MAVRLGEGGRPLRIRRAAGWAFWWVFVFWARLGLSQEVASGATAPHPTDDAEANAEQAAEEAARVAERLRPVAHTWQTGMGLGLFFPSSELGLVGAGYQPAQFNSAAFEFFGRIGYLPTPYIGVEGEVATMLAGVSNEGAAMYAFRTQILVQYPNASVIPFGLVGIGGLGGASGLTGHDIDVAFHLGAGLKFPLTPELSMRFDVRENLSAAQEGGAAQVAASEEFSFGIELTVGRPDRALERSDAPADRDGDRVPDELDSCPEEPALTADGCPMDSDGDGLDDLRDVCPTDAGLLKLRGCPELDSDDDGVNLPCDRCPDVPGKGMDGCPIRDSDADGLLDDVDQCRDQPETPNGYRDGDGCPDELPTQLEELLGARAELHFGYGSAALPDRSEAFLDRLAQVLLAHEELSLEIRSHAFSAKGVPGNKSAANQLLSQQRALSIVQALVSRGVPQKRLHPSGVGDAEPLVTEGPWRTNERVELVLQ